MASIDKQEFTTLLKASKVCGAGTSTGMSGNDIDVDFVVVNNHYEANDSQKGALKLYEFMDMLIRVSLKLKKPAKPKLKRAQTSANLGGGRGALLDSNFLLPGCLDELLDAYIVKHQGVLIDKDQMMGRYLMSPVVQQVLATHEEQLRSTLTLTLTLILTLTPRSLRRMKSRSMGSSTACETRTKGQPR
mgnify:CR=1 FL=1